MCALLTSANMLGSIFEQCFDNVSVVDYVLIRLINDVEVTLIRLIARTNCDNRFVRFEVHLRPDGSIGLNVRVNFFVQFLPI